MPPLVRCLPALAVVALLVAPAGAQQLYKYVGPDGRVQYTDRPPAGVQNVEKVTGSRVSTVGPPRRPPKAPPSRARPRPPRSRSRRSGSGAPKLKRTPRSRRRSRRSGARTTSSATRCGASLPGCKRGAVSPCPTRRASASFSTNPRSRTRPRGCSAKSRYLQVDRGAPRAYRARRLRAAFGSTTAAAGSRPGFRLARRW